MFERLMKNFGFISEKKVARAIGEIYKEHDDIPCDPKVFTTDCAVQSALNLLCSRLEIKPMHRNELGGGTGEMID